MSDVPADDPLAALRARIEATQQAAERLAAEAAEAVAAERSGAPGAVPPNGWEVPRSADDAATELQALVALVGSLRGLVPPEVWQQATEIMRQLLLLIRALIDWWVARLEAGRAGAGDGVRTAEPAVEDIAIS